MCKCVPLPTPAQLRAYCSPSLETYRWIESQREAITSILQGEDSRVLLVAGPCSVHSSFGAIQYAKKLKILAKSLKETFLVAMRVYYEKPRTSFGWKGMLHDPYMDKSNALEKGLMQVRSLLVALAEMHIPVAAELLSPFALPYLEDLLTWGCIGARTSESQTHRELASSVPFPVGIKNPTSGDCLKAIHSILSAAKPHTMFSLDDQGRLGYTLTKGNSNTLLVLRGGKEGPNYDSFSIQETQKLLINYSLPPRLMVDCSHDNSRKDPNKQAYAFHSAIEQIVNGNQWIKGVMLESYLETGIQDSGCSAIFRSATDPCLDWESTKNLILSGHNMLVKQKEPVCV